MMGEELYCKWIKPRLKAIIKAAKEINPDVIVFYHSGGFVEPLFIYLNVATTKSACKCC